nr:ankyrin repeat domain-containing protein [Armatimonas sp.]
MAFSWKRARRAGKLRQHRDVREDLLRMGRYAPAPISNKAAPVRFCPHSWTTLWGAAALGYAKIVKRFLESGATVNQRDEWGRTALWWAVHERRFEIAERLLAFGANPDQGDETGIGPLHLSIRRGDTALATLLLSHGARPEGEVEADKPTPLMWAVRRGDAALVETLLRAGARTTARDRWGHTAIFYVQSATAGSVLPLLLEAGAAPTERAGDHDTPLHRALRVGDARLWKALVPADDLPDFLPLRGRADDTLLHAAAEGGNPTLVARLIDDGTLINGRNAFGHTPLLVALTAENLRVTILLTQAGATIGFLEAIAMGDAARASELWPRPGTLLDAPISGLETPLMGAIARGRAELVERLLAVGASPNAGTRTLGTPLDVAVLTDQPELARLLLARGADPTLLRHVTSVELRELLGEIPEPLPLQATRLEHTRADTLALYEAAVAGDDALRFLLLCGANLDMPNDQDATALMLAARDGDAPAVQRLLTFGAAPAGAYAEALKAGRIAVLSLLTPDEDTEELDGDD